MESKKPMDSTQEEWNYNKEKSLYTLEDKYVSKYHTSLIKTEGSLEKAAEDTTLQSLDPSAKPSEWKGEVVGDEKSATNYYYSESFKGQVEKLQALYIPSNAYFSRMVKKDGPPACDTITEYGGNVDPGDHEDGTNPLLPIQEGEATTGEYATNLAESVLQDAFLRLSHSQPTPPQESAVGVFEGSTPLPNGCSTEDAMVPRSWNDLPRIVVVQSPDGSDAAL